MRDAVHGEGVEPDFFFHDRRLSARAAWQPRKRIANDEGSCCIPAAFGKIKFRHKHDLPKKVYALSQIEMRINFAASAVCNWWI
jgi:hypothetical protein